MPDSYQFFGSHEILEGMGLLVQAQRLARNSGQVDKALALAAVIREAEFELRGLGVQAAERADEMIRAQIKATAVRPETTKPKHLLDAVKSVPGPLGSIHVALLEELDKAADAQGRPYWRAQEYGLSEGFVGRVLRGVFLTPGGYALPNPGRFREHSEFELRRTDEGIGGWMRIQRPIEARHFLERGSDEAWAFYQARVAAFTRSVNARLDGVIAI